MNKDVNADYDRRFHEVFAAGALMGILFGHWGVRRVMPVVDDRGQAVNALAIEFTLSKMPFRVTIELAPELAPVSWRTGAPLGPPHETSSDH